MLNKKIISLLFVLSILFIMNIFSGSAFAVDYNEYTYELNKFNQDQYEHQMLQYINEARQKEGIAPLQMSDDIVKVARLKSQDMIIKDYFSHTSPTYGSPFEMLDKFGIGYRTAGENLAGHYSVQGAHEALMDSPGHRKNILNSSFTHIGIGIVKGGPYGMMFTQMFVGEPNFANTDQNNYEKKQEKEQNQPDDSQKDGNNQWVQILSDLINSERGKQGLAKLNLNTDLMAAAQLKADEMVAKNYLGYKSPTYGYVEQMLNTLNIPFAKVAENIVGAYDLQVAHRALMNSAKHKARILNPEYTELGIGVQEGGRYGFSIVEFFVKQDNMQSQPEPEPQPTPEPEPEPEPEPQPKPEPKEQNGAVELEKQLLELINTERLNNGLAKLNPNQELTNVARLKAQDMVDNNYLSYYSPTYGRTGEMLQEFGVQYISLAENIVAAPKIDVAHRALMNSARQKANTLNTNFQEIGVGIVESERYGYIIVELFTQKTDTSPQPQPGTEPQPQPEENPASDKNDKEQLTAQEQMELEMLTYINEARRQAGVAPLKMKQDIVEVARLKSQDMIDNNYFAHTSPTYGSPFEMMDQFGIDYRRAGENLAGHYSVSGAHEALMNSTGHRRNILDPSFTHIGIGIVEGGPYSKMFTQMFVTY